MQSLYGSTPQEILKFIQEARPARPEREPSAKLQECCKLLEKSSEILEEYITKMILENIPERSGWNVEQLQECLSEIEAELFLYNDILSYQSLEEDYALARRLEKQIEPISISAAKPTSRRNILNKYEPLKENTFYDVVYYVGKTLGHDGNIGNVSLQTHSWAGKLHSDDEKHFELVKQLFFSATGPLLARKVFAGRYKGNRYLVGIVDRRPKVKGKTIRDIVEAYHKVQSRTSIYPRVELYENEDDKDPAYILNCVYTSGSGRLTVNVEGKERFYYSG